MRSLLSAIVGAACCVASYETGLASPVGLWLVKDGAKIRIRPCGRNLCGFIVQSSSPGDPPAGGSLTDKNNLDPSKRNRSLVGVEVLISMHHDAPTKWSGQLYNNRDGQIYSGNLIETGPSSIRIEGCWLGICGGEDLTRTR